MKTNKGFTLIELMIVVAIIAIIAAIAIPNLLQSRMQANESNAIAALRTYASAQATWKKANYGGDGEYCTPFENLSGKNLIPGVFAAATAADGAGYQGYWFDEDGSVTNWAYEFGLFAMPCVYEKSGINTYHIGAAGEVRAKDTGGNSLPGSAPDSSWFNP